jgi:hypothetical protein
MLRPGTTLADAYESLKRPPLAWLSGEYVRAELVTPAGGAGGGGGGSTSVQVRLLKKDEVVPHGGIVRIMTNRRSHWQK